LPQMCGFAGKVKLAACAPAQESRCGRAKPLGLGFYVH
jgi:hypothetical protein